MERWTFSVVAETKFEKTFSVDGAKRYVIVIACKEDSARNAENRSSKIFSRAYLLGCEATGIGDLWSENWRESRVIYGKPDHLRKLSFYH